MSSSPALDLEPQTSLPTESSSSEPLLICLPSIGAEASAALLAQVEAAFVGQHVLIATSMAGSENAPSSHGTPLVPYTQPRGDSEWVLRGSDYIAAAELAEQHRAQRVILLGTDASTLHPQALQTMQVALSAGTDLALPRFHTTPDDGLVNSALLYPLTRALFAVDTRFPLPLDAGLSSRLLARLADSAERLGAQSADDLLWPVAEASIAGFSIRQVEGGRRVLPQPSETDLNTLFPTVTASLFADVEAKATYWQRARALPARTAVTTGVPFATGRDSGSEEIRSLVENFRVAFNNLREIWSLVLPPQSLLSLKKLSVSSAEGFSFPPSLWARTVYDFALAFHLRTLNRGHLLGALTPLYLAWVASFLRVSEGSEQAGAELLEVTATAFEQEKPYFVSRWRWPDRFNP